MIRKKIFIQSPELNFAFLNNLLGMDAYFVLKQSSFTFDNSSVIV